MPLYNEGAAVADLVAHLAAVAGEIVLVDASDEAESVAAIEALSAHINDTQNIRLIRSEKRGRAAQMNAGAAATGGEILLFLHGDTRLPNGATEHIIRAINSGYEWGWFDLRLSAAGVTYRLLERAINLRARLAKIATGDHAMFVTRDRFGAGFADLALMEDVEICRRLKRESRPAIIAEPVITSARRWQKKRHRAHRDINVEIALLILARSPSKPTRSGL